MASPKKVVDLSGPRRAVSRIRRDPPPPPPRKVTKAELREQEARVVLIGIVTVGLAIFVLTMQLGRAAGWSPSQYVITVEERQ